MVVMICIQNNNGEFLMQKRALNKGGDWGVTGGHPKAGETPEQGIVTKVREELVVDITGHKLEIFSEGCDGRDCYKMYYLNADLNIEDMVIQQEELSEVKWFSMRELKNMVEKRVLNPNQIACFVKCENYLKNKSIKR